MERKADLNRELGVLFPVCDGDERHFDRFLAELTRLGFPFAVHFDHCSAETKRRFKEHPLFLEGHEDDDPNSFFGEDSRQSALDILVKHGFAWMLSFDVDETLEKNAPEKIRKLLDADAGGYDVIEFPLLDLWGDARHYRVDGPFQQSHREKMFRLGIGRWRYTHATIHAPMCTPLHKEHEVRVIQPDIFVMHWGIMNMEDVRFHTERWNRVYEKKIGKNPYGFYPYMNDPVGNPPDIREFDPDDIGPDFARR